MEISFRVKFVDFAARLGGKYLMSATQNGMLRACDPNKRKQPSEHERYALCVTQARTFRSYQLSTMPVPWEALIPFGVYSAFSRAPPSLMRINS